MTKIDLMFFAFGKEYTYNDNKIVLQTGIFSKNMDTINFIDIRDIKAKSNIFGWGEITIIDTNGTNVIKYVKNTKEVHDVLNDIFISHKNRMKKVDII